MKISLNHIPGVNPISVVNLPMANIEMKLIIDWSEPNPDLFPVFREIN